MTTEKDFFPDSQAYDRAMGRMSRIAGEKLLDWLSLPAGLRWLDVGCGTGAFTGLVHDRAAPGALVAIDPSARQIAYAKGKPGADRIDYRQADALALPFGDGEFDVAVLALVVQYLPDPAKAMAEISRVVRPGGTVAAYVWPGPHAGHPQQPLYEAMKSMGAAHVRRPGTRIRTIEGLTDLFVSSGFEEIAVRPIEIRLDFRDFDDYWSARTGETVRNMTGAELERLKSLLRARLPADAAGRISYAATANAIGGRVPGPGPRVQAGASASIS